MLKIWFHSPNEDKIFCETLLNWLTHAVTKEAHQQYEMQAALYPQRELTYYYHHGASIVSPLAGILMQTDDYLITSDDTRNPFEI